jgi:hypothetical protein
MIQHAIIRQIGWQRFGAREEKAAGMHRHYIALLLREVL